MSRKLLLLLAIPLLLVIVAAILVSLLLDKEKVVAMAADALHEQTGATLEVKGDVGLSLFPALGVSLTQTSLTTPDEQGADIRVGTLDIGVQFMPLLSGRVEIDSITLDDLAARVTSPPEKTPAIDTSGMNDAQLEAFYAARRKAVVEAGEAAGGKAMLAAPFALNVGRLSVTDSRVELVDAASGEATVIRLDRLLARDLNLEDRPIPLELDLTLEGERPLGLQLDGRVRVSQQSQTLTLEQAEARVTGATAQPVILKLNGPVDIANQVATLQLGLELGASRGEGSLRYASFESPRIDASLQLNLFDPALLALAGPEAAAKSGGEPAPAGGDEPLPLDALRAIDSRADLHIDRAIFDAHEISDLDVQLRAVEGDIQVTHLTGQLHGGALDLTAGFNARLSRARLDTRGSLGNLDVATALAALESEPSVTGAASLTWTLAGSGTTPNELVQSLAGPLELTTEQVVIQEMALEKMFCQAVALVNQQALSAPFPTDSALQDLSADVLVSEGRARLDPLRIDLNGISLRGKGNLDLLSQDFQATFSARISPQLGELDPACRIDERYTAMEWPVKCKGNTAGDPGKWCAVDTGDIIEQLAKGEAKRKLEKEAGKLLDKLFK